MADCNIKEKFKELDKNIQEKKIPFHAIIELTYRCNLKCMHCYCVEEKGRQELSLEETENLLKELARLGCFLLTLSGGEALMREDFFDILKIAQELHYLTCIFTNGINITPSVADKIAQFSPSEVELSLYGTTAQTHERITRVKGSFEKTCNAIHLLRERGVDIVIKWVLMKDTFSEHKKLVNFAQSLGLTYRADPVVFPTNDRNRFPLSQRLSDEELIQAYMSFGDQVVKKERRQIPAEEKPICGAGHDTCCISPYGDVYPCVQFFLNFGNIRDNSFSQIWYNSSVAKEWRKLKSYADLPGCRSCEILTDCTRCPGLADLEDGDYLGISQEACRCTRAIIKAREQLYYGGESL